MVHVPFSDSHAFSYCIFSKGRRHDVSKTQGSTKDENFLTQTYISCISSHSSCISSVYLCASVSRWLLFVLTQFSTLLAPAAFLNFSCILLPNPQSAIHNPHPHSPISHGFIIRYLLLLLKSIVLLFKFFFNYANALDKLS